MTLRIIAILTLLWTSTYSQKFIDTKFYGQKILDGTFKLSDDDTTFQVLDSLFCKNPADKDFYFRVARKIQTMTDGALGEYFSGIASKYYFEYNTEFVRNSKKMTEVEIDGWLGQACYDITATEQSLDSLPKIKKQLDALVTNCKCSDTQKAQINKYNKFIYSCVNEGLRNP
jgi:hypothetical protein